MQFYAPITRELAQPSEATGAVEVLGQYLARFHAEEAKHGFDAQFEVVALDIHPIEVPRDAGVAQPDVITSFSGNDVNRFHEAVNEVCRSLGGRCIRPDFYALTTVNELIIATTDLIAQWEAAFTAETGVVLTKREEVPGKTGWVVAMSIVGVLAVGSLIWYASKER